MYPKYHKTAVDVWKVQPYVKELVDRCGTIEKAGEYALVGKSTIARILHVVHGEVQQTTARKIMVALDHRRLEDRENGRVHERLLMARRTIAKIESDQDRKVVVVD